MDEKLNHGIINLHLHVQEIELANISFLHFSVMILILMMKPDYL